MAQLQNLTINNTDIFDLFYPVGSIYETSNADFNPNNVWSGTWERIKGKVIVGVDEDDSDFSTVKKTGGNKTVNLTIDQIPSHRHAFYKPALLWGSTSETSVTAAQIASASGGASGGFFSDRFTDNNNKQVAATGGGQAHTNLQPYYTAYIWERIS